MEYNFREIEKKWREYWKENEVYKSVLDSNIPKYYVLEMFPYPSGSGLHVGHPLGYIAGDIYARYKRLKGFNVLHPMGFDAYGLPAEQYAIQTGQHPAVTTEQNIKRYREQLDILGFSYDWSREVRTCDPKYYKWTQWAFIQMFNSYYSLPTTHSIGGGAARPISELIAHFEKQGSYGLNVACGEELVFSAKEWNTKTEKEQQEILLNYRLAYLADMMVNWCPALGTVLANDEVVNGVSVRGGHPVERKTMRQWSLRISAYAQRLLDGLEKIDWSDSLKEIQRNWIGRSEGAAVKFSLSPGPSPQGRGVFSNSISPREGEGLSSENSKEVLLNPKGWFNNTTDERHWKLLINLAKEFRSNQTEAEDLLWREVRANKIGYKIRRQHIVNGFIADFINLEKQVIIEIDGSIHFTDEQREKDELRTTILNHFGFTVVRFTNDEVLQNVQNVVLKIKNYLDQIPSKRTSLTLPYMEGLRDISPLPCGDEFLNNTPLPCGEGLGVGSIPIFTTRPDTIFGVTFMVVCPEYEWLNEITTEEQRQEVEDYVTWAKNRSERERQAEVKKVSGVFTGSYTVHPFTGEKLPIWVSEYVLAGYGTGAIMAVPAHDSRDFAFARHFNLPIVQVVVPTGENEENPAEWKDSKDSKEGICINSDFINGQSVKEAGAKVIDRFEEMGIGTRKINFRLRDAIFSRQRYWGEPFPIYYKDGIPYTLNEDELPLLLPDIDKYLPTESGEPPLARAKNWKTKDGYPLETSTMPGFAGSSAYYFRYMDIHNDEALMSQEAINYWQDVDLYIGGAEHATGHLIYARFWNMFLYDLGFCPKEEPFKKLINQGMIQGRSNFVYRIKETNTYVSFNLRNKYDTDPIHVDINIVDNDVLDINAFRTWHPGFSDAEFILEDGKYICGYEIEKMSKSMYNVQNPDDLVERYGADTLRLYEMFLGPLEQSKPWDIKGIEGTARFIKKLWRLYHDQNNVFNVSNEPATNDELKALHKLIKKIADDIERFSFNTAVSAFMICVNELSEMKCNKREILEPLCITIATFAPHIAEELWNMLGHTTSITQASYPTFNETYIAENSFEYPVSVNGKMRFKMNLPLEMSVPDIEKAVVAADDAQKWLEGKTPKKIIVVQGKIINLVV